MPEIQSLKLDANNDSTYINYARCWERKHNFSNCFSSLCEEHGSIIYAKEIEIDEVSKLNWNFTDWSASVMKQDVSDKYLSKFCLLGIRRKSLLYLNWIFVPGTWGKIFWGRDWMKIRTDLTVMDFGWGLFKIIRVFFLNRQNSYKYNFLNP